MEKHRIAFSIHPDLLSKQLGSALYGAGEALRQVVANALDSDASQVDVRVFYNDLETPEHIEVSDDGCGMSPKELLASFGRVGFHLDRPGQRRSAIGSRGIGRFAVFSLAAEAQWETIARADDALVRSSWTMTPGKVAIDISEQQVGKELPTGTVVRMALIQREDVVRLLSSVPVIKRTLFNAFAGYLARYGDDVKITVNGEGVEIDDYVDQRQSELISAQGEIPEATLHHMVLGAQVEQVAPSVLVFASSGAAIKDEPIPDESIPMRKYLGVVDSRYLSELTNTGKSDLADFDAGFRALKSEATRRAKGFIAQRQDERAKEFLEVARARPFYPYKEPPRTPVERYSQQIYDSVLLAIEEEFSISRAPAAQQQLVFALTRQLLQSEDLAAVLTEVLQLKGEEVERFAALLRATSLSSVIAVAELLVDRLRFLDELEVLVYGTPARHVRERSQLHRILEGHTWLFGEQYHLMGSDRTIEKLLPTPESEESTTSAKPDGLKLIPDLYLARGKWNEGGRFTQHLVVELKRPAVRVDSDHVQKLKDYARAMVESPVWSQQPNHHRFTFVLVSSEISERVKKVEYQEGDELGMLSRPNLAHTTELWALTWSDFIEARRQELRFLTDQLEITADPELLGYLKSRVGDLLPPEVGASR